VCGVQHLGVDLAGGRYGWERRVAALPAGAPAQDDSSAAVVFMGLNGTEAKV